MGTLFQESTQVMREMLRRGVVSPYPTSMRWLIDGPNSILKASLRQLSWYKQHRKKSSWVQKQDTWQLPQTRRYQVSIAPTDELVAQTDPTLNWLVELARWQVPKGYFGVVKSVEQVLSILTQGVQDPFTISANWGDPFVYSEIRFNWHFRLSPVSEQGAAWLNLTGAQAVEDRLPGIAYTDLTRTPYLWYPAASCAAHNVHLPIPGTSILRGMLFVPARTGDPKPLSAALRLTGTTQAETTEEAQTVARENW